MAKHKSITKMLEERFGGKWHFGGFSSNAYNNDWYTEDMEWECNWVYKNDSGERYYEVYDGCANKKYDVHIVDGKLEDYIA